MVQSRPSWDTAAHRSSGLHAVDARPTSVSALLCLLAALLPWLAPAVLIVPAAVEASVADDLTGNDDLDDADAHADEDEAA